MATKVVTIVADKGGTAARQEQQLEKAKKDLEVLTSKATRTISVNTIENESRIEFIAVVELPEGAFEEKKDQPHHAGHPKHTSKKEK